MDNVTDFHAAQREMAERKRARLEATKDLIRGSYELTDQEIGIIIASLRECQYMLPETDDEDIGGMDGDFHEIATDGESFRIINSDQVNALCEYLGTGSYENDN